VRSAAAAQDWDYAARVLAQSGLGMVMSADLTELESVLALIPADRAAHDPAVGAAWAGLRLWRHDPDGAGVYLENAGRALAASSGAMRRIMEPTLMALRIMQAAGQDRHDPALAREAWALAGSAQPRIDTQAEHRAQGLLWLSLGIATHEASRLADFAYTQVRLARDDLAAAQRLLDEVDTRRAGHLPGEPALTDIAALMQARILLADGDAAAARAVLSRLRDTWARARPAMASVVTVAEALAALRAGDTGRARALLLLADDGEVPGRSDAMLIWAGLLLAEDDFAAAAELVAPYTDGSAPATPQERIAALLVAAVAHRGGAPAGAPAGLVEQALALAEPERAHRVFLDGGAPVRSPVTVLVPPTSRQAGFAGRVLERFDAQSPRLAPPAARESVSLTDSEQAVLCFLPSHMTNEEISQALFLSINTVKTHLRSAYRKLGVGSRREAIARGRRMGLL
jgi:LuxR family maltose regulon positive regulatory protein